jgi:uncharacterized protein (TIGR03000 family)
MLKKSLWGIALCTVASVALLLTPATSEAQRGGRGGGGRGGGGGSWNRGGGSWNRGGDWNRGRGWGWGGFGTGVAIGYGLGNWGYGYGGYYGSPYYYGSDYYSAPTYYYQQPTYVVPQQGYYGNYDASGFQPQAVQQPQTDPNAAEFTVTVLDPNTQIWFQDHQTQQRGTVREFESPGLQPGQTYTFQIRARVMQNGQPVDQFRKVQAQAGQHVTVDFSNPDNANTLQSNPENIQAPRSNVPANRQQNAPANQRVVPLNQGINNNQAPTNVTPDRR